MHYRRSQKHILRMTNENFVNAHSEAAAECIPTKQRAKPRVLSETLVVRKKCADIKTASKCNRRNPTNINALKLKAQKEFANIYLKEQTEYIQNQINKIRDLVEDRQSRIAWQTKWVEGRAQWKLNWKLTAKKNEYNYGNNISRIYSESLRKLHMNLSRELLVNRHQTRIVYSRRTQLSTKKNLK